MDETYSTNDPLGVRLVDKYGRLYTFVYKWPDPEECDDTGFNQIVTSDVGELIEILEDSGPVVGVFELWRECAYLDESKVIPEARSTAPKKQFPKEFYVELDQLIEKYSKED
jgi:hypothetical protein